MKVASKKNKARRLQQWVRDVILLQFPLLNSRDVKSAPMGVPGADIQLSTVAKDLLPYAIECKNTERFNLWKSYEQAQNHAKSEDDDLEPVVIVKRNRSKPLAIVDADYFFNLRHRDSYED
jgi:hypothetical protein